ncbi:hypothetical protein M9H77_13028 [Catharanthus roseus]|uniref:Uncharacterized protein n=1 Tax=Catharanthus roseus TaxID=4058 RepID=A0ACC0BJ10_CATRO|nr:hypothetical protein M9H77_13028 [Catharanthus roseus]
MDGPSATIFIGLIEELQHFIRELTGMAGTLVHDSVSKCEDASSYSASTKDFLKMYILLFSGRLDRVSGNTLPKTNCLRTRSGMYGSTQSKYAMNPFHVKTQQSRIS